MALKIAKNSGLTDVVSSGTNANPISTQHPITGSTVEQKLYLFNDDATKYYQNVNIDPTDAVSTDESTWVYLAPDNAGAAGTYGAAGAALTMANIGAAGSGDTTGKAFWCKVISPSGQSVQNKTDIKLTVNYREFAV
jgi:hypothetical protein